MQLPEKDDFILFPRQAGELVKITWYQNFEYREAEYYRTVAYTFKPKQVEVKLPNNRPLNAFQPDEKTKCQLILS